MPNLRLSILDQCPIPEGYSAGDALRNSIDLARLADGLGYYRYWVAEHHGTQGQPAQSRGADRSHRGGDIAYLRVGSGELMLPHYSRSKSPRLSACSAGLFPGRIDLGIGRAAGTTPKVAFALQRDRRQAPPDDFREQLAELLNYLANRTSFRFESPEVSRFSGRRTTAPFGLLNWVCLTALRTSLIPTARNCPAFTGRSSRLRIRRRCHVPL